MLQRTSLALIVTATFLLACSDETTVTTTGPGSAGGGAQNTGGSGGDSSSSSSASGASGGGGSTGSTGGGGEAPCDAPPQCGDGCAAAGELCLDIVTVETTPGAATHNGIVALDCDGDTHVDLIVTDLTDDSVTALRNVDGSATDFGQIVTTVDAGDQPTGIAMADLDGDEWLDLAIGTAGAPDSMRKLVGQAECLFNPQTQTGYTITAGPPSDIAFVDLNDDQIPDLAAPLRVDDGYAYRFEVDNSNVVEAVGLTACDAPSAIAMLDIDDNDLPDMVLACDTENRIGVALNNGNGFGAMTSYPQVGIIGTTGDGPDDVALGYIDDMGEVDATVDAVVSIPGDSSVAILTNNNGEFTVLMTYPVAPTGVTDTGEPQAIALHDMDNDGDLDIVTANHSFTSTLLSSVSILLNDGTGVFEHATTTNLQGVVVSEASATPIYVEREPAALVIADLNGDGAPDIGLAHDYAIGQASKVTALVSVP